MKITAQLITVFTTILFTLPTFAMDWIAVGGIRYHTADPLTCVSPLICTPNSNLGYELGGLTKFPILDWLNFQTGALLVNRIVEISYNQSGSTGTAGYNFWHLDVPLQAQIKILDWLFVEGGIDLGLKISSNCYATGALACSGSNNDNSFIFPLRFGASAIYDKKWSLRFYYEMSTPLTTTPGTFGVPSKEYKSSAMGLIGGISF